MAESKKKAMPVRRKAAAAVLFAVAAILLILAAAGYLLRGSAKTQEDLENMQEYAVIHAASDGLVESIALQARADKLAELRSRSDFRKMGLNEVNETCDAAAEEARQEAMKLYSNPEVKDEEALSSAILALQSALESEGDLEEEEKEAYADLYTQLIENVPDWTDLADENADDDALWETLVSYVPALGEDGNAHMKDAFLELAHDLSDEEREDDAEAELEQLTASMTGSVADWSEYEGVSDDELWDALVKLMPELEESGYRDDLLAAAKEQITLATSEEAAAEEEEQADETTDEYEEAEVDYGYFTASEELASRQEQVEETYEGLWEQLTSIIPDLEDLDSSNADNMRSTIEGVIWPGSADFTSRYNACAAQNGSEVLSGSSKTRMKLAARALIFLVLGTGLLLLALVVTFWKPLTHALGVPRTIIGLFFIYLCLAAMPYGISVSMMLGNVLIRMGMYGVLVLAMLPGIQCGIGLNMGMTIGCITGLLGIVLALQFDMTGVAALAFACISGAVISLPLGWAYSKLLNRMKGNEMTISTYVGFSFVSLMCIGWMVLPFNNRKIIWLLSGHGLRVTHSLLGSFAHLLDRFLAFEIFGIEVPTGVLLFVCLCCFLVWLFTRSRLGIAMSAAGSNPRFAEASGINVDRMRTIGTMLSTMIAAVGIVIYSQAFGYAQLYTAPRQLGFIAASAILIGGATVSRARVSHVLIGTFLFEGVLVLGQQIANAAVAGGGLSEVMRIMISNGIILYALTQSGGGKRE